MVSENGKPAHTEVTTIARLCWVSRAMSESEDDVSENWRKRHSLIAVKLHTGRTHQIRIHMLSIGHPLVCDAQYAERRFHTDRAWCPRNFLHAYHLGLSDVPEDSDEANTLALVGPRIP